MNTNTMKDLEALAMMASLGSMISERAKYLQDPGSRRSKINAKTRKKKKRARATAKKSRRINRK